MNGESLRIERTTATAVTSAMSRNVGSTGTRCQMACPEKKVANRIAVAAPSMALAVTR